MSNLRTQVCLYMYVSPEPYRYVFKHRKRSIEFVPPKVDTPVDFHLEIYHSQPMGVQYVSI